MAQMKYFYELTISSSPHAHSPITTQTIMRDVLIALVPAMLGSIYFFGFRALTVTLVSVAACMFWEWAYCKVMKLHDKTRLTRTELEEIKSESGITRLQYEIIRLKYFDHNHFSVVKICDTLAISVGAYGYQLRQAVKQVNNYFDSKK
jgi:hypothetical protein